MTNDRFTAEKMLFPWRGSAVPWGTARDILADVLRELRFLYVLGGIIDNGYCALCGSHRLWETPGSVPRPCENADCHSHAIDRLLGGATL